jgi:hypothetical protein
MRKYPPYIGFEVLAAMAMKSVVLWAVEVHQSFGGVYFLCVHGQGVSYAGNGLPVGCRSLG